MGKSFFTFVYLTDNTDYSISMDTLCTRRVWLQKPIFTLSSLVMPELGKNGVLDVILFEV